MTALYNECDSHAAAWLRRLVAAGHIAPGNVDSRRIEQLKPEDLDGFAQVHLFAGIGAWSHALRLAGWPDDRPVWTISCPCQPFSDAGTGRGLEDERHLWPIAFTLLREHRPHAVFGEQVSSQDGLAWFDAVSADLEDAGYAVGAIDTCAASVGAPHKRQRLFFVGDAAHKGLQGFGRGKELRGGGRRPETSRSRGMADHDDVRRKLVSPSRLHADREQWDDPLRRRPRGEWDDCDWVLCDDPGGPRWRAVEPGTFPLVDGATERVGRLRGYGNAIVPRVAAEFIRAYLDVTEDAA